MPKTPIKITRTRTAASKTKALKFKHSSEKFREVEERQQKQDEGADSSKKKGKARKGTGKPVGGGPFGGDIPMDSGPSTSTSTKGITVEPIRKEVGQQVQRCTICDGLGHQEQLCQLETTSRPPVITCKQCSHSYKYADNDQKLLVEVSLNNCQTVKLGLRLVPSCCEYH